MKCRLSEVAAGQRVTIYATSDPLAERRLVTCGLIDGVEVTLERRAPTADPVLRHGSLRVRIPARLADRIWVQWLRAGEFGPPA